MHLLIRSIDFDTGTISVEVRQPVPVDRHEDLLNFVDFCRRVGLLDVHLGFRKPRSMQTVMLLMELRKAFQRMTIDGVSRDELTSESAPGRNSVLGTFGRDKLAEHAVRLCDMRLAPERIGQLILLIGTSLALDDEALHLLRLCLYELVANTTEHADFESNKREIQVTLTTHPDCVNVVYRDNAGRFSTVKRRKINVRKKMKSGDKRGLGLFMLDRMSENLSYQRHKGWNETTFSIARSPETSEDYARRKTMTTLSMEVNSLDFGDAMIIKTKGSINSNTAPALDGELEDLMNHGHFTIVIDLEKTDFISSSGIGVLLGTVTNLRDKGGDLILMNVPRIVEDIFEILDIRNYFRTIKSLDDLRVESH
jgi:anti-sigma B factor antagonist